MIGNIMDEVHIDLTIKNIKPICQGHRFVGMAHTVKEITCVHGTYTNEDF
jgi:hypothetical protein